MSTVFTRCQKRWFFNK